MKILIIGLVLGLLIIYVGQVIDKKIEQHNGETEKQNREILQELKKPC